MTILKRAPIWGSFFVTIQGLIEKMVDRYR